ncbi:hypothetical protein HMPREF9065_01628 [Aggregatibacter sp. oral taxon 458 str. W10330]|nr:hypothetical protein HMPREF9065_01628 [Aggregatibacter sp. oral taxon 458 str. W10330]
MLLRQSQPTTLTKETYDRQRKRSDLWKYFSINVLCVIHFARSAHLDARPNHAWNVI